MQQQIEDTAKSAGFEHVAQLNRDIGDHFEVAKMLDRLDGKKVLNGQMGKHMLRLAGTIAGSSHGPLGSVFGAMGGDAVSRLLASQSIASPMTRYLLRDLEAKDPESYAKVIEWIKQQNFDREGRLLLPSGTMTGTRNPDTGEIFNGYGEQKPIPMGGKTLPNAIVVSGKKPPASYEQAVNRSAYEENKGMKPTVSVPETQNIIDATDEKATKDNTDQTPIIKY
jgi:hypothetical protein